jgi:hypothetical protein
VKKNSDEFFSPTHGGQEWTKPSWPKNQRVIYYREIIMKVSIVRPLALAGSLACMAAFQVVPAAAADNDYPPADMQSQQSSKTRAEVRSEYLQALKEGTLPITSESDTGSFGSAMSAKAPAPSPLTRQAVRADTIEWLRLNRGDVQMGGQ